LRVQRGNPSWQIAVNRLIKRRMVCREYRRKGASKQSLRSL
jgi:hypothetical protein